MVGRNFFRDNKVASTNLWTMVRLELLSEDVATVEEILFEEGATSIDLGDGYLDGISEKPIYEKVDYDDQLRWDQVVLLAIFPHDEEIITRLQLAFEKCGLDATCIKNQQSFPDRDWVLSSRQQFPISKITKNFWVVPSWEKEKIIGEDDIVSLIIDPGAAFGTGSHATTRLCLSWLVKHPPSNRKVIDYGCGSGILGIAAKKLGASSVIGYDIDEEAIFTAQQNSKINLVEVEVRSVNQEVTETCDLLVANILTNPLIVLAPLFASLVVDDGKLILSGILRQQENLIISAFNPWFSFPDYWEKDGWLLLQGTRKKV